MLAIKLFATSIVAALFMALPVAAQPATPLTQFAVCGGSSAFVGLGLEPWYACIQDSSGRIVIDHLNDVWLVVLTIIEDALKIGGYIAVGFIVWGGIKYIKSNGAPGEAAQARDVIRNALIGLVITLVSVAIVEFVVGAFN